MQNTTFIKKYQIFISSTYEDLKYERTSVIQAILNMGNIPSGMEFFNATRDNTFDYIKEVMNNADYYILILGERYGTPCANAELSYTEMEYNYAISQNIPVLVFFKEIDTDNLDDELFKNFRKKVLSKHLGAPFKNIEELIIKVISSINESIKKTPRPGWIREASEKNQTIEPVDYIIKRYPIVMEGKVNYWYEKYKSGKIRQGGNFIIKPEQSFFRTITFPTAFMYNNYLITFNLNNNTEDYNYSLILKNKTTTGFSISLPQYRLREDINVNWLAEGF